MALSNQQQQGGGLVSGVSNGQLPDESTIEKLFPKCPPKQLQQSRANNFRQNRSSFRHNDGRHQQKRHNRLRIHQQQRQQEILIDTTTSSTSKPIINTANSSTTNLKDKSLSATSKIKEREYFNSSSDSSDRETNNNAKLGYAAVGSMKRATSNHYGFDTNNTTASQITIDQDQMERPALQNPSRQRTRKYTASKNLQKQLERSQSGYKLDSRAPPVDSSHRASEEPTTATTNVSLESSTQHNQQVMPLDPSNGKTSSSAAVPYATGATNKESARLSRTCRGIVFAEPPPPVLDSIQPELLESCNQNNSGRVTSQQLEEASEVPAESLVAPRGQSPERSALSQVAQSQARSRCETADADSCKNDVAVKEQHQTQPSDIIGGPGKASSDLFETGTNYSKHSIEQSTSRILSESFANVDKTTVSHVEDNSKDDDKYINLFVYENATPPKRSEDEVGLTKDSVPSSSPPKRADSHPLVNQEERHQLLAADLSENEQDVIRNDTSVEELCDFDYEAETERRPFNKSDPIDQKPLNIELEIDASNTAKPYQKHHKPIGTLQTVDEKAEINDDDATKDSNGCSFDDQDSSKHELIDITGNNSMFDEESFRIAKEGSGLTPPGFPRRIRPSTGVPAVRSADAPVQNITSTSENFLLSPANAGDKLLEFQSPQENEPKLIVQFELPARRVDTEPNYQPPKQPEHEPKPDFIESSLTQAMNKVSFGPTEAQETGQNVNPRQHHKLPNETSHFSIARSISKPHAEQNEGSEIPVSRMQFNTLSDAESEPEGQPNIQLPPSMSDKSSKSKAAMGKKQEPVLTNRASTNSLANCAVDDDLVPSGKTALVFPRLDEGLSSDAESCDDEAEDDDRAMEADVDADDDDDDEDDDDDDDDDDGDDDLVSPSLSNERSSLHSTIDPFLRLNQVQMAKPQNRMIGSLQQQQGNPMTGPDLQQNKSTSSSPYANFKPMDQSEAKSASNYPTQNGSQAHYWPGTSTQSALLTQPSSTQSQFNVQRGQQANNSNGYNMNMSIGRPNNYANRDEAKSVNRLSSDTDNETDRLLGSQRNDQLQKMNNTDLASNTSTADRQNANNNFVGRQSNSREVLIEGILFDVKYLGSTQTECEGRGEKEDRIHQAELAVHEVKFRNGDGQQPARVKFFISTEKIMVLDDDNKKIIMDHSLRTISYIADIGDAFVLIVRKKSTSIDANNELGRPLSKTSCYVFESNESHTITKYISQAFHVAFTELMKANGTADGNSYLPKELDYQEVLNSQEMSLTELEMFARKDNQREVIVPKQKGEILGISIVESGWGSVLPTAVIAGLKQDGPAYRCKKLSVGDQILSINGNSLVGLSLAECQKILRKTRRQTVARLSVVPCPITVEVKIKRPDTKYQLGFSVQHGVICSLLRGGIAERGGVRVGHRIISINGTTVVGVPHDKIVTLLASSVGEIRMQTCLTSLYRHMLGEEKNVSFV